MDGWSVKKRRFRCFGVKEGVGIFAGLSTLESSALAMNPPMKLDDDMQITKKKNFFMLQEQHVEVLD